MEYVYVIVPLRLDWEPVYRVPEGTIVNIGDRVKVRVAGREYIGVVHSRAEELNVAESRIQPILENCSTVPGGCKTDWQGSGTIGAEQATEIQEAVGTTQANGRSGVGATGNQRLAPITAEELQLWEFVSEYYMCTIGEVYKAAYPAARVKVETTKSRRSAAPQGTTVTRCKRPGDVQTCRRIYDSFASGRPALLVSGIGGNGALSRATGAEVNLENVTEIAEGGRRDLRSNWENATEIAEGGRRDLRSNWENATEIAEGGRRELRSNWENATEIAEGGRRDLRRKGDDVGKWEGRPGENARRIADILARRTVDEGRSVLILSPEVEAAPEGYLQYNSTVTPAARRDIAQQLRSGKPCIVAGTRLSVFLPFTNLGLVVILDEHNAGYKQAEPAPRYNGRDLAVKLAAIHGANVLLCSEVPSLESLANCDSGKYIMVQEEGNEQETHTSGSRESEGRETEVEPAVQEYSDALIDTTAEKRKNGMIGSLSRKLIARMSDTFQNKQRVALLLPWKDTDDIEIEARKLFPEARTRLQVMSLADSRRKDLSKYKLIALLCADFILKGQDFRADEKALRQLTELQGAAGDNLIIQTADAAHPIFKALVSSDKLSALRSMMPLRNQFLLPPYSRLIDIIFKDNNEARRAKMMRELSACLPVSGQTTTSIRICLPKNHNLSAAKQDILKRVTGFLSEHNYREFVHFDVDPF